MHSFYRKNNGQDGIDVVTVRVCGTQSLGIRVVMVRVRVNLGVSSGGNHSCVTGVSSILRGALAGRYGAGRDRVRNSSRGRICRELVSRESILEGRLTGCESLDSEGACAEAAYHTLVLEALFVRSFVLPTRYHVGVQGIQLGALSDLDGWESRTTRV